MTISNRQAGEQGKLGGDVLELAKRADEPREVIGIDYAAARGESTGMTVHVGKNVYTYATREDVEALGIDLGFNPAPGLVSGLLGARPVDTNEDIGGVYMSGLAKALRGATVKAHRDDGRGSIDLAAKVRKILNGSTAATASPQQLWDLVAAHIEAGFVTLPPGVELQVVEPPWPNPSSVEAGQLWDPADACPRGWTEDGLLTVESRNESNTTARFRSRDSSSPLADIPTMLDPASPFRCVGYELPDGKRVMVGEYRAGDSDNGQSIWRVSALLDGARVRLTSPTDCASQSEVIAPVVSIVSWRIIASNDAGWAAARAESIATVAKMKFDVRETTALTPGFWGELAKQYLYRQWSHRDSNGEVQLVPGDHSMLVEREASFADLRFTYHTIEGTPAAPVLKASVPVSESHDIMDKLFSLSGERASHDLVIPTLGTMRALLVGGNSLASSARPGTMDLTLRFVQSRSDDAPAPKIDVRVTGAEACAAAFQPLIDATLDAAEKLSPGRRAMIEQGWKILDE